MVNGEPSVIPSFCGANCSYTITLDGPYFVCNASVLNATLYNGNTPLTIYDATYAPGSDITPSFQAKLWSPTAISNYMLIATQQNLTCLPYRAEYVLSNIYENSVPNLTLSTKSIQPLVSFNDTPFIIQPLSENPDISSFTSTSALNWTNIGLQRYRDINLLNIINVVAVSLSGQYNMDSFQGGGPCNTTISGFGNTSWCVDNVWTDGVIGEGILLGTVILQKLL